MTATTATTAAAPLTARVDVPAPSYGVATTGQIITTDVTAVQAFQQDRQHRTTVLLGLTHPDGGPLWYAAHVADAAAADALVAEYDRLAVEQGRQRPGMTAVVPPLDQTPALPEDLRRERFRADLARRACAAGRHGYCTLTH